MIKLEETSEMYRNRFIDDRTVAFVIMQSNLSENLILVIVCPRLILLYYMAL